MSIDHIKKYEAGYSLLSTASLLVVLGVGMVAGISLYKNQDEQEKIQKNRELQLSTKKALENYFAAEGRYPCPAPLNAPIDSPTVGKEVSSTCPASTAFSGTYEVPGTGGTIRIGALPTRTLNIDDAAGFDAWGSKIIYAVSQAYAGAPPVPVGNDGNITIIDSSGNNVTQSGIYTFILPGKDKRGMFSLNGVQNANACNLTVPAGENCDFSNGTFYSSIVQYNDSETAQEYTATLDYAASHDTYVWNMGAWGPCSCASHSQVRTVSCVVAMSNIPAPNSACLNISAMPVTVQTCTPPSGSCPVTPPIVVPPPTMGGGGGGGGSGHSGYDTDGDGDIDTTDHTQGGDYVSDGNWDHSGGGGGGGGSSRVICTHFYKKGMIARDVWLADLRFTAEHLPRATVRGYHFWAIPYVRLMRENKRAERFMWPLAMHRAKELAYQMGVLDKPDYLGKIIRMTLEPVCFVIGLFVKEQNYKALYTAKELRTLERQ